MRLVSIGGEQSMNALFGSSRGGQNPLFPVNFLWFFIFFCMVKKIYIGIGNISASHTEKVNEITCFHLMISQKDNHCALFGLYARLSWYQSHLPCIYGYLFIYSLLQEISLLSQTNVRRSVFLLMKNSINFYTPFLCC